MKKTNIKQLGIKDFLQRESCPCCGSRERKYLGRVAFSRYFSFPAGRIVLDSQVQNKRCLVQCTRCGLVYHQLVPSKQTIAALYSGSQVLNLWDLNPKVRGFEDRVKLIESLLGKSNKDITRVLDVGCHTGKFLALLPRSYHKYGIEPNPIALEQAQKVIPQGTFWRGFLEDVDLPAEHFQLIIMWDVIEHLFDVRTALEKLSNALAKGGYLVVETGNYSSIARIFGRGWYYWNLLEHFNFFNLSTLENLFAEYGLRVQQVIPTVHHASTTLKEYLTRQLKSFVYVVITGGGRLASIWVLLSALLGKAGSPPMPVLRDHMLIVATKEDKSKRERVKRYDKKT